MKINFKKERFIWLTAAEVCMHIQLTSFTGGGGGGGADGGGSGGSKAQFKTGLEFLSPPASLCKF